MKNSVKKITSWALAISLSLYASSALCCDSSGESAVHVTILNGTSTPLTLTASYDEMNYWVSGPVGANNVIATVPAATTSNGVTTPGSYTIENQGPDDNTAYMVIGGLAGAGLWYWHYVYGSGNAPNPHSPSVAKSSSVQCNNDGYGWGCFAVMQPSNINRTSGCPTGGLPGYNINFQGDNSNQVCIGETAEFGFNDGCTSGFSITVYVPPDAIPMRNMPS
jgi:hypothetical protein